MRYRKKPVVIEAIQFGRENMKEVLEFMGQTVGSLDSRMSREKWEDYVSDAHINGLHIKTLEDGPNGEARHVASLGDWIIKGISGEFYPCKPDIFEKTYEPVEAANDQ